jgi:hypothetical protein
LQTRDNQIFQEGRDVVTVCEWTDRIYQNTQPEHIITNVVSGRKMRVQKYNFPDTVVWNPWLEKARDIPDFGDDEFPNMICVESGHVSSPVILLPGTAFEASQILQVAIECPFVLPTLSLPPPEPSRSHDPTTPQTPRQYHDDTTTTPPDPPSPGHARDSLRPPP